MYCNREFTWLIQGYTILGTEPRIGNLISSTPSIVLQWIWLFPPLTQLTEPDGFLGRLEWVICGGSHLLPVIVICGIESLTFVMLKVA